MTQQTMQQAKPTKRPFSSIVAAVLITAASLFAVPSISQEFEEASTKVEYRLSAGDKIDVFVWKEEDLSKEVTISPDGTLSYPLAGDIEAAGLTVKELRNALTQKMQEYIPKALVTVSLVEVSGYRVYVLGEVNKPGEYLPGNYVTIAQALTLAEGLTTFANGGSIRVVRQSGGQELVMKFDYGRFKRGRDLSRNVRLESGDVVMVP